MTRLLFDAGPDAPWWAFPWPNDALWPRGMRGMFPHPVAARFRRLAEHNGPSPSGCAYFSFDGPLEPESIEVGILDLQTGAWLPAEHHVFTTAGRYHPAHMVAVEPYPGFVMRSGVAHGVIVRGGGPGVELHPELARLLDPSADGPVDLRAAYAPLREMKPDLGGVVAATVFTPSDPTTRLRRLLDTTLDHRGTLEGPVTERPGAGGVRVLEGHWHAPSFRTGRGRSVFAGGVGTAEPVRTERVPFALVLPPGEPPPAGFPLILSLHGGGANFLSRLPEIVGAAAPRGLAVAQQALPYNEGRLHGGKVWGDIAYFNVLNPEGSISLFHQAVVEQMLLVRLLLDGPWPIDPDRIFCIGHSNGGTTAAMLLAVDPLLTAGVVAGFGGHIGTYVEESSVIGEVMDKLWPRALTLHRAGAEPRTRFHPLVNLAHTAWGVWDTVNFAPHWQRWPLSGRDSIHVYLAQGLDDPYASVRNTTAVITAAGLDVAGEPEALEDAAYAHWMLDVRERTRVAWPVSDNVRAGDGFRRTGVATEVAPVGSGHEVCFEDPAVLAQWVGAFDSLARTGRMVVQAPVRR